MKTARRLSVSGSPRARDPSDARPGISPVDIADHNSRTTLGLLRRFGPLTRQELSRRLGLTEPAIAGIVQRLATSGLVTGRKRASTTRYAALEFALCPDAAFSLGISIAPEGGEIVVIDLSCAIRARKGFTHIDEVGEALGSIQHMASGKLVGCGVAIAPGASIDRINLEECIGERVGPLYVLDDSEAAIGAERALGIGDPEGGLVTILIDDTVRAGLLIGGRPFRGIHGLAGQIGDMRSGVDGATLNEVATLPSLECHMAAGHVSADAWITVAARHLHEAVLAISGFIAPGAILIGGSLPDDILASVISSMAREREEKIRDLVIAPWIPVVQPATHPKDGVVLGAALRPFNETLFPA
ncbi:ROK family transcriptional regulator [Rhizobium sp. NPDC090275]|uniref:ROK family transcriptional regulator n=1 Tax=Rhizobium sp. NPDC090275 TaxID=3364498 RepID=UPI00383B7848